jgi:hypothetical protein
MADIKPEVFQSAMRGQHEGRDPEFLDPGQAWRLVNVSVRGGRAASRPAFSVSDMPADGVFQGCAVYRLSSGDRLVAVVSGAVWVRRMSDGAWTLAHTFPTTDFQQAYFCQVDQYFVVQNGVHDPVENWPLILDGDVALDNLDAWFLWAGAPDDDPEGGWRQIRDFAAQTPTSPYRDALRIPIGRAMAYVHGRLFVAVDRYWEDGAVAGEEPGWRSGRGLRFWLAGNVFQPSNATEVLCFSETIYLGGKAGGLPAELGTITALAPFRNAASGSGIGALVFLSREGANGFAADTPRESWGRNDNSRVLFNSGGSDSPWSMVQVNADLVYYGRDGLRSIRYTASTESGSGSLSTTPLSPEIRPAVDLTDRLGHAPFVTLAHWDNYVFSTLVGAASGFRAIAPWDVAVLEASGASPNRAFAGYWAGQIYHGLFSVFDGLRDTLGCVMRRTADGPLVLGLLDESARDPAQVSRVYTPRYAFGTVAEIKRLHYAELSLCEVLTSALSVRVGWRVDGDTRWHWTSPVAFSASSLPAATGPFRLPFPSELDCVSGSFNGRQANAGTMFQFVIEWTGGAALEYALFHAKTVGSGTGAGAPCETVALSPSGGEDLSLPSELESLEGTGGAL